MIKVILLLVLSSTECVVCLCGMIFNLLATCVLFRHPGVAPASCLLLGLALSDLGLLTTLLLHKAIPWTCMCLDVLGLSRCSPTVDVLAAHVLFALLNLFYTSSIYLVLAVAVDRYIAVNKPFLAQRLRSRGFHIKTVVIIMALSLLVTAPRFFEGLAGGGGGGGGGGMAEQNPYNATATVGGGDIGDGAGDVTYAGNATTDDDAAAAGEMMMMMMMTSANETEVIPGASSSSWAKDPWYVLVYVVGFNWVIRYVIPFPGLVVTNTILLRAVMRAKRHHADATATSLEGFARGATVNVVAVISGFLLCQTPVMVTELYHAWSGQAMDMWIHAINAFFLSASGSLNFCIYCIYLRKFRRALCSLCRGTKYVPAEGL